MYIRLMPIKKFFFLCTFLFLIPIQAQEDILLDIKSMRWKKINRKFQNTSSLTRKEAFVLARFHEESPEGNSKNTPLLYYSVLLGNYPTQIGNEEILQLTQLQNPIETAIQKVSLWKLYNYLVKKNLLNISQKLEILEKFGSENEPITINAWKEKFTILDKAQDYEKILSVLEKSSGEKKNIFNIPSIQIIRAKAIFYSLKDLKTSREIILEVLRSSAPYNVKRVGFDLLKKILGNSFFEKMSADELALCFSFFSKKEKEYVWKNFLGIQTTFMIAKSAERISKYIVNKEPEKILDYLNFQSKHLKENQDLFCYLSEELISMKKQNLSLQVLNTHLKDSQNLCKFKILSKIYYKLNDKDNFFYNVMRYLVLNPYDLVYQDRLIDFLVERLPSSIRYAKEKYWEIAISEMPNLPVKGRLVYWYLRFLKQANQEEKLLKLLEDFYKLCPGSYYVTVIEEEFEKELNKLSKIEYPFLNRENLIQYLSRNPLAKWLSEVANKNLDFAYYPSALELLNKIREKKSLIFQNQSLSLAIEYFMIGEFKHGMYLLNAFAKSQKYSEKDLYELYIAAGDASNYTYLYMYYTRVLMKLFFIPDDPLLLPSEITKRLYPRPHRDLVLESAKNFEVEEEIIYAIMRQESFFRENARSPANAKGLMQVMPKTGNYLAKKLNIKTYSLYDPEVSIPMGTKFLADLLKNYEGKLTWASIAYNGGPGNLRKWKRNHYKGDFNHFLEEIPAKESRDYCRVILSNYRNYKLLTVKENWN